MIGGMAERGLPIVDGAPACPFVAFDDARDDRSDRPDPRHRCFAENPPAPRARAHQEAYCLSSQFPVCPTFQDWARREAARVLPLTGSEAPAARLRDDPPQRPAAPSAGDGAPSPDRPQRRSSQFDWSAPPPWIAGGGQPDRQGIGAGPSAPDDEPSPSRVNGGPAGAMPTPASAGSGQKTTAPAGKRSTGPGTGTARAANAEDAVGAPGFLRAPNSDSDDRTGSAVGPGFDDRGGEPYPRRGTATAAPPQDKVPARRQRGTQVAGEGLLSAEADARAPGVAVAGSRPAERPAMAPAPNGGWVEPLDDAEEPEYEAPGLATLLGLDRRPRVGATRPARQPERRPAEPAWERPRRYEAYPSLRTRVGMPVPSRLFLSAGALVIAALALFFIPPLFIQKGGGTVAPEGSASSSVAASSAASAATPTPLPTPKQKTYTVKPGDVLSTIAKRFGITIEQLLAANKQIKNPDKIAIGAVIVIPSAAPSEIIDGTVSSSP